MRNLKNKNRRSSKWFFENYQLIFMQYIRFLYNSYLRCNKKKLINQYDVTKFSKNISLDNQINLTVVALT